MDLGLDGRTAVVCGASSGIGLGIAEALVEEGANVAMFARRRDLLEREAERLRAPPALAREVGTRGITVNAIAPGRIDTARLVDVYPDGPSEADLAPIALRRLGTPREIGSVACFLASDHATYVTGAVIPVDGGLTRFL